MRGRRAGCHLPEESDAVECHRLRRDCKIAPDGRRSCNLRCIRAEAFDREPASEAGLADRLKDPTPTRRTIPNPSSTGSQAAKTSSLQ